MNRLKAEWRYIVYAAMAALIIYSPAYAQQAQTLSERTNGILDEAFLFRAVLSGLLAILIWVARGQDSRLKAAEEDIHEFHNINATRTTKLEYIEGRIGLLEHEQRQLTTLISMQRELLLTKYPDKDETERHRVRVEDTLSAICTRMERVESRLANYARATHRHTDDIGNDSNG